MALSKDRDKIDINKIMQSFLEGAAFWFGMLSAQEVSKIIMKNNEFRKKLIIEFGKNPEFKKKFLRELTEEEKEEMK